MNPTKLLHGLLYAAPVLLLTLGACGGGGSSTITAATGPFTIGGAITGLTGTGLVLRNNGGDDKAVASGVGSYTFSSTVASGGSYNVSVLTQPSSPTQLCSVTNGTGTATANVTNANVACVSAYTISGTITGAASGIGPILQNNLGDNLLIPSVASGVPTAFTFSTPIANGAGYSVTQLSRARTPSQDCSAITGGTGTVSGAAVSGISITCTLSAVATRFAYVANSIVTGTGVADTVSAYTVAASGVLAASTTPTTASGDQPYAVATDPTGQFAYVVNSGSDSISAYTITAVTGALVAISDVDAGTTGTQASIATGDNPLSIAIHPTGKFAYVANQGNGTSTGNTISAYSINVTSGVLSAIDADGVTLGTQATIATGTYPYSIAVDPLGKFAYVANYNSDNVSVYAINQTTGALTAGTAVPAGDGPASIAIDPTGKCVLVANNTSDNIYSYLIDSGSGALTSASTAVPSGSAGGSAPRSVAIDPATGLYAYVANAGEGVSAFSVNPTTCVIASIDADAVTGGVNATIAAGTTPFSANVDPSGQFVYVANFGSNNVSVYGIGAGGALTLLQTLATGAGPTSVTTTQ